MITGDEQRFHELVHNALAGRAKTAEEAELKALLARNPALQNEFEQLKAAAAAAREILPLMEHMEPPSGRSGFFGIFRKRRIPPPPIQRLKNEVERVLARKSSETTELGQLLSRLEQWAREQAAESRDIVMTLIATVRQSITPEWLMEKTFGPSEMSAVRYRRQAGAEPKTYLGAAPSLFERLSHLETRLTEDGRITPECRQEIEALLEVLKRPGGSK